MSEVIWKDLDKNEAGITKVGIVKEGNNNRIVGYDNIVMGEEVMYNGNKYKVLMMSQLGYVTLTKDGVEPYDMVMISNIYKV